MIAEKEVRKKFGLTQEQLALYLDVSVGLLKMVEIGRRDLPIAAVLKLYKLEMFSLPSIPAPPTAIPNASIEKHKNELRWGKLKLEKQLEGMQTAYQEALNSSALAKQFLNEQPTNRGEQLMLQSLEYKSEKALKKNSLEEQEYLEWQIGCIDKMLG